MVDNTFRIPQRPEDLLLEHHPGLRVSEGLANEPNLANSAFFLARFCVFLVSALVHAGKLWLGRLGLWYCETWTFWDSL